MKQFCADQKSWVFEDTSVAEVVGEGDSLFHVGESFGWGRVDCCKQFECCYGAQRPAVPGAVAEQRAPVALRDLPSLDVCQDVCVENRNAFQRRFLVSSFDGAALAALSSTRLAVERELAAPRRRLPSLLL